MSAWNKGLTKETDVRIKSYSDKIKGRKFSEESKQKMSETKKRLFAEGKIIPWHKGQTKENNPILLKYGKKLSLARKGKPLPHLKNYQFTSEEITKRNLENNLNKRNDIKDEEVINLYLNKNLTLAEITKKLKCSTTPITRILKKYNIPKRKGKTWEEIYGDEKAKEMKLKHGMPLENNPNWKGGISFLPYSKEFTIMFKNNIMQRDGLLCLKCGMRQEDSQILFNRKLHIHHINYDKSLSTPENCCSLCQRCNSEVNANRTSWTKFFQSMLSERYNYKYSEDGDIVLELEKEIKK